MFIFRWDIWPDFSLCMSMEGHCRMWPALFPPRMWKRKIETRVQFSRKLGDVPNAHKRDTEVCRREGGGGGGGGLAE